MLRSLRPPLALALCLAAGGLANPLLGTWSEQQGPRTLELRADGSMHFAGVAYRFQAQGNLLAVQGPEGGGYYQFQLQGDQLVVAGADIGTLHFRRAAAPAAVPAPGMPSGGTAPPPPPAPPAANEFRADAYGFRMALGPGWRWRETDAAVLFGHETIPGLVVAAEHDEVLTAEDVAEVAQKGYHQPPGFDFSPRTPGKVQRVATGGGQGYYFRVVGKLDGKDAEGFVGVFLTPASQTLVVLTLAEPAKWAQLEGPARSMLDSVRLYAPIRPPAPPAAAAATPLVQQWDQELRGNKILYMWSYSSSGGGGSYGSTSSNKEWHLCPNGSYWYRGRSHSHIDTGTAGGGWGLGNSSGRGDEQGRWRVATNGQEPIVVFEPQGGQPYHYVLSKRKKLGSSYRKKHFGDMGVYADGPAQCQ